MTPIHPLIWESPYATGGPKKDKTKKTKNKKQKKKKTIANRYKASLGDDENILNLIVVMTSHSIHILKTTDEY